MFKIICKLIFIFREDAERSHDLVVGVKELADMLGHTAELIGTNVNANPYGK